jgi:hypothetical protein
LARFVLDSKFAAKTRRREGRREEENPELNSSRLRGELNLYWYSGKIAFIGGFRIPQPEESLGFIPPGISLKSGP